MSDAHPPFDRVHHALLAILAGVLTLKFYNTAVAAILFSFAAIAHAIPIPAAPTIDAKSYVLIDAHSGQVLASQNSDAKVAPASITKIMTAYVVFHALREGIIHMDDMVPISEKAWRMGGSRMFVEVGHKVSVKNLLQGMIVQSGNDATVALAQHVAGTEQSFVAMMNSFAAKLGMTHTHYMDASGLPHVDHYTTAKDVAVLTRALIREFPDYYKLFDEKAFTWNDIHQNNRNLLLWRDPSVDGVKTGHTESAGYCLVASALRNNMRLIAVVMGTPSIHARANDAYALLNYGYNFYEGHKLYAAGDSLTEARVWKGAVQKVSLGLKKSLYVTIPKGQYSKLKAEMKLPSTIIAPINTTKSLGTVDVTLNGKPIASEPLYALKPVAKGGLWRRAVDSILLWFHK